MTIAELAGRLSASGLTDEEAARKVRSIESARGALPPGDTESGTSHAWFVPGRVEVFGKHTDYAGGCSLLAAAERGFCLVSRPRRDDLVGIVSADTGQSWCSRLHTDREGGPDWTTYARAVVRRVARNFPGVATGADIAFASDLPPASGMSSSSALVVGLLLALSRANDLPRHDAYAHNIRTTDDLAAYAATLENGLTFGTLEGDAGVGTFGGSEDHTAILGCRGGSLSEYAFCPTRLRRHVPLPPDLTFAIASSGVTAAKTGGARDVYNQASLTARQILESWNSWTGQRHGSLAEACGESEERVPILRGLLIDQACSGVPAPLDRLDQFVEESFRLVPSASDALARRDLEALGQLADRSQSLAESKLGNQVPETIALARGARALGAHAASAFGAGFGGSVWALVSRPDASRFVADWRSAYLRAFPSREAAACFFTSVAGPGAFEVW